MTTSTPRYIINYLTKTYHDGRHLTEQCNTDQISHKERMDTPPYDYASCKHCIPDEPEEEQEEAELIAY